MRKIKSFTNFENHKSKHLMIFCYIALGLSGKMKNTRKSEFHLFKKVILRNYFEVYYWEVYYCRAKAVMIVWIFLNFATMPSSPIKYFLCYTPRFHLKTKNLPEFPCVIILKDWTINKKWSISYHSSASRLTSREPWESHSSAEAKTNWAE